MSSEIEDGVVPPGQRCMIGLFNPDKKPADAFEDLMKDVEGFIEEKKKEGFFPIKDIELSWGEAGRWPEGLWFMVCLKDGLEKDKETGVDFAHTLVSEMFKDYSKDLLEKER